MDDWHNGTIQGMKNTVAAKEMKKRAAAEMAAWVKAGRPPSGEPKAGRKLRPRRRRLISHEGAV